MSSDKKRIIKIDLREPGERSNKPCLIQEGLLRQILRAAGITNVGEIDGSKLIVAVIQDPGCKAFIGYDSGNGAANVPEGFSILDAALALSTDEEASPNVLEETGSENN